MSENTTPRLYPLATLPLDVAFNRMKQVLEQATGSPLKDTAKNTQKIGEALATFCGEASWHALHVKSKALSNSTNESDYEREIALLRRILVPVANSFLIDNSQLVKDALAAGVNLQHYLKPRTDDEFVMHVESAWDKVLTFSGIFGCALRSAEHLTRVFMLSMCWVCYGSVTYCLLWARQPRQVRLSVMPT